MKKQDYIYHYTSIQTLALILETRKIRLSSLKNMDDLDEAVTKESEDFGKYCLVSCWTRSTAESIPLWNMYTDLKGVRIGLPKDMFDITFDPNEKDKSKVKPLFQIPVSLPYPELIDIEYVEARQSPSLFQSGRFSGDILGREKSAVWSFQQECRFRIFLTPFNNSSMFANLNEFNYLGNNGYKINNPKEVCDFQLRSGIFSEMEILLCPSMDEADKIIVEALADKYGITKKQISKSSLRVRRKS